MDETIMTWKDNIDLEAMREHLSKKVACTPMLLPDEVKGDVDALIESRRKLEGQVGELSKCIAGIDAQLWEINEKPKVMEVVGKCFIARRWNVPPSHEHD